MKTTMKTAQLGFVAAMLLGLIAIGQQATAQDAEAGRAPSSSRALAESPVPLAPTALAVNHVLQRNYFSSGTLGGAFLPAFTNSPIDGLQTIVCPGPGNGTCTIQADHWVELQGSSTGNEAWGCLVVDGNVDPNCGFIDNKIPPDASWVQATSSHFISGISIGTHTIQTVVSSTGSVNAAYYNINYRVFKP
jgi:hypothetical protein